ncbi:MAG TPA: hypothetical protein VEZ17_07900 [Chitinophagaceae bacterium]|jgi:hypothetical protein|nr:hypothetical protein [Chitinophagaceae bacterium]
MQLKITHSTIIKEIQIAFNQAYPNLWIEFYSSSGSNGNHFRAEKIQPKMPLSSLGYIQEARYIDITHGRSVEQLEYDFCETLGLKIKVFRKSGNVWVGTSLTGNWSLANQNWQGDQVFNE